MYTTIKLYINTYQLLADLCSTIFSAFQLTLFVLALVIQNQAVSNDSGLKCPAGFHISCYTNLPYEYRHVCPNATCVPCGPNTYNNKEGNVAFECKTCSTVRTMNNHYG